MDDNNIVDVNFTELNLNEESSDSKDTTEVEIIEDNKKLIKNNNDTLSILNKSRDIVLTSYDITSTANKIYNVILYTVQKTKTGNYKCKMKTEDLLKLIKSKDQKSLDGVKEILTMLKSTSLIFWNKEENKDVENDYNLITGRKYIPEDDIFEIEVPDTVYNHITKYKGYAPLNLDILSKFKSFYAQRMYELLRLWSRYNSEVEQKFSLEELRFVLGVGDKYPRYTNFKQKVLMICQKELKEKANMDIEFIDYKTGRRTSHVIIKILDKERKRYFSYKKINNLKDIDLEGLSDEIKNNVNNMITELETNLQENNQQELNNKVSKIKDYILREKAKLHDNDIYKILSLLKDEDITEAQAEELWEKSNHDFDKISEVYAYAKVRAKSGKVKTNIFAYMKGTIGPGEFKKANDTKTMKFNDFQQREYDYDDLEYKLLGWDKDDDIEADPNFNNESDKEDSESVKEDSKIEKDINKLIDFLSKQLVIIVGDVKYNTWLKFGVENLSIIDNQIIFLCGTELNVSMIERNYMDILNELIQSQLDYKDLKLKIELK